MTSNFLELLDASYKSFQEARNISLQLMEDELVFYESLIPKFFSQTGEAEGVRRMYSSIDKIEQPEEMRLNCVDVLESAKIYDDYIAGMQKYVGEIIALESINPNRQDLDYFKETFESVKEKDGVFVTAIFGGSLNPAKDLTITESTSNIEELIEFLPRLKEFKEMCKEVTEAAYGETDEAKKNLLENSASLMIESVVNYSYSMIRNIFETYDGINNLLDSMNEEPSAPDEFKLI